MRLNQYMDHTLLKQDATKSQLDRLCDEAAEHGFCLLYTSPSPRDA